MVDCFIVAPASVKRQVTFLPTFKTRYFGPLIHIVTLEAMGLGGVADL